MLLWHQALCKTCCCSCYLASSATSALSFSLLSRRIRTRAFRPTEVSYCDLHPCLRRCVTISAKPCSFLVYLCDCVKISCTGL